MYYFLYVAVVVEAARKKRQVVAVYPTKQFVDDLHYKSVDLNQDGQPDVPVYPAVPYALPYGLPYAAPVAVPTVKYVAPTPLVAPAPLVAPLLAKHTIKTLTAEADPSAPTPAATTKFDLKEKSFDVVSPIAYHHLPYAYSYPFAPFVAAAPAQAPAAPAADDSAVTVEAARKKRQVVAVVPTEQFKDDLKYKSVDLNQDGQPDVEVKPFYPTLTYALPYGLPYAAPVAVPTVKYVAPTPLVAPAPLVAPLLAKHTIKTLTAEADPSAPTPAATTKFDLKEKSFDVVSPVAYHVPYPYAYAAVAAAPAPEAAAAPVTVEAARKKRQAVVPTIPFFRDLAYNSVDLNKDGQPDKAVYTSPLAYHSFYPYTYPYYG